MSEVSESSAVVYERFPIQNIFSHQTALVPISENSGTFDERQQPLPSFPRDRKTLMNFGLLTAVLEAFLGDLSSPFFESTIV